MSKLILASPEGLGGAGWPLAARGKVEMAKEARLAVLRLFSIASED